MEFFDRSSDGNLRVVNGLPRFMKLNGIKSDFEEADGGVTGSNVVVSRQRMIIVANQLPILARRDRNTKKWCFHWDEDALVLQLRDGFSPDVEVLYVGSLTVEVDSSEQQEVAELLLEEFRCVPTFLSAEIQNEFYHGFCKHYLWPLFHYMLPISPSHGARFVRAEWEAYVTANRVFTEKVKKLIEPDEDSVWIHDYHLMVLPIFLRKWVRCVKLGFFLHSPFPSSEIYRTSPVRNEILQSLLNCDLIGFHTFDYARHFLSCCSRMLGLDYKLKRGYIGLEYLGRTLSIKILPVGIHMGHLESVMSQSATAEKARQLKEQFKGKILMLGIDDMDMFKGISLKFLAMGQLLEQQPELRGTLVLIQIVNPARSMGKDVCEVHNETNFLVNKINQKYGKPGYQPIVLINGPVTTQEKVAYYAISECCVVNAARDGMNLVPYKYTVCRQGSPVLDKALGIDRSKMLRNSVLIVSEFIGCSPSLSGAIRVNPWDIDSVSEAMNGALRMSEAEKHLRHEKHYKYISSHDVAYWARSFNQDLERACREHDLKRFYGMGLNFTFRIVALDPNFRKLSAEHIVPAYKKTSSRLILLDYDGTVMPQDSVDKTPSSEVIKVLNDLCSDPKNVVFIVSGRGKDSLSKWFAPCEKLGIAAEHGYFTRWIRDEPWESCMLTRDFDWKKTVEPVMEHYTQATDGSFIEHKETGLVWHHQDAESAFGSCQAKELLDHLESVLANEPVVVKRGDHIVEVKVQGVSKGIVVEDLISTMQNRGKLPDFVLCMGETVQMKACLRALHIPSPTHPCLPSRKCFSALLVKNQVRQNTILTILLKSSSCLKALLQVYSMGYRSHITNTLITDMGEATTDILVVQSGHSGLSLGGH